MILCLECKRLWPSGSNYCGICRATLGKRLCPEGHVNLLSAGCCTVCGDPRLTRGTHCLNLRFLTWIGITCLGWVVVRALFQMVTIGVSNLWVWTLNVILPPLVTIIFVSVLLTPFMGERGSKRLGEFWSALFKVAVGILALPLQQLRLLLGCKNKRKNE